MHAQYVYGTSYGVIISCMMLPHCVQVLVQEPASGLRAVPLTLVRSGAYGEAIVTWNLTLLDSTSLLDVGATAATVTVPHGGCRHMQLWRQESAVKDNAVLSLVEIWIYSISVVGFSIGL